MVVEKPNLLDMNGVMIGHWTDATALTGCTVISFEPHALTAAEVRGAAPGTRELDALAPGRLEQRVNAIVLTGGSAFGLRAADGVALELARRGRGYPTSAGSVPIVPAAVIFDLATGVPIAPLAENGRDALLAVLPLSEVAQGPVGAGTGARWNKFGGASRRGGLGIAQIAFDDHLVTAVVVLNAIGTLRSIGADVRAELIEKRLHIPDPGQATTLIAVVTTAPCDHGALTRVCVAAHAALARMVVPAHTMLDGDVAFASTIEEGPRNTELSMYLSMATELAVEEAILRAATA